MPNQGVFIGVREANGLIVELERNGPDITGTFSQVNGDRSMVRLQATEPNLASGILRIGNAFVVMTLESLDVDRIAIGTVPLDADSNPIVSAARGFEFVRQ